MIHVNITGRCGNQLFQYAFARKLSLLTGDMNLELDFYNVQRWQRRTGDPTFDDQVQHFNVLPYVSVDDNKDVFQAFASPRQRAARALDAFMRKACIKCAGSDAICKRALEPHLNHLGIYYHETETTHPVRTGEREKLIKGYFEDKAYFDDIRDVLIAEFTPRYPECEKNQVLYDIIRSTESVCITFRKWGEVSEEVRQERDVCNKEYYQAAIAEMLRRVPDATFIVFSDDVDWVKGTFEFGNVSVYYEDGTDEIWEKLRMMYSCKHFIMTTSTFAWWAQYLCRNEDKIVISPDRWYSDGRTSLLLEETWVKIPSSVYR